MSAPRTTQRVPRPGWAVYPVLEHPSQRGCTIPSTRRSTHHCAQDLPPGRKARLSPVGVPGPNDAGSAPDIASHTRRQERRSLEFHCAVRHPDLQQHAVLVVLVRDVREDLVLAFAAQPQFRTWRSSGETEPGCPNLVPFDPMLSDSSHGRQEPEVHRVFPALSQRLEMEEHMLHLLPVTRTHPRSQYLSCRQDAGG
eukprot:2963065-Rhodomonas_salina.1